MPDEPQTEEQTQVAEEAQEDAPEVAVERTGPCEVVIRIEADADALRRRYQEDLVSVQSEVALPGFRRGKAPAGLVERRMGSSLRSEVVSGVIDEGYEAAVKEHDLEVVADLEAPQVDEIDWEPGQPLAVEFRCEVLPEVEIEQEDYTGLEVEVPALEVDDELMEQEKRRFAEQFATWEEVSGEGIDWDDYVSGRVSVEGVDWSDEIAFYPRAERIGPFEVEGVKAAMSGASVGDELELQGELTQDDVIEGLGRGDEVTLKVTVENAVRRRIPEIDDELATKIGLESVEEIEEMVRERLSSALQEERESVTHHMIVDAILERLDLEMPASLISRAEREQQTRNLIRMLRSGVPREQAEQRASQQADETREGIVRALKREYILRKIAEKERILVTESEVDSQIRAFAARQGWREEKAEAYLEERGMLRSLRADMREAKTLEFLVEKAQIEEVSAQEFQKRHGHDDSEAGDSAAAGE